MQAIKHNRGFKTQAVTIEAKTSNWAPRVSWSTVRNITGTIALVAMLVASVGVYPSANTVNANHDPFGGVPQTSVKICHITGNGDYIVNSPSISATGGDIDLQGGHTGHGDNTSGDIIPPFHFDDNGTVLSYPGKFWNAVNEDIWNRGDCKGDGILAPQIDLAADKIVSDATPNENQTITYTVTVTNNGPSNATGVVVNDLLPVDVAYVSHVAGAGSYNSGTGVWTVGNLNDDAVATLTITVTVDSGTGGDTIINTASADANEADTNSQNDSDSVSAVVNIPDGPTTGTLTVIKTVVNDDQGNSDADDFTLHVKNSLDADVTNSPFSGSSTGASFTLEAGTYSVSEDTEAGYTMTGFSGNCTSTGSVTVVAGQTVTCTITNNDNEPGRFTLDVTITGDGEGLVSGEGINCDSNFEATEEVPNNDCSETYPSGTVVELTATPDEGSNFNDSWTVGAGTCTGNNSPCSVTMNSNISLTAHFGLNSTGGGGGSRSGGGSNNDDDDGQVLGDFTGLPFVPPGQVAGAATTLPRTGVPTEALYLLTALAGLPFLRRKTV